MTRAGWLTRRLLRVAQADEAHTARQRWAAEHPGKCVTCYGTGRLLIPVKFDDDLVEKACVQCDATGTAMNRDELIVHMRLRVGVPLTLTELAAELGTDREPLGLARACSALARLSNRGRVVSAHIGGPDRCYWIREAVQP